MSEVGGAYETLALGGIIVQIGNHTLDVFLRDVPVYLCQVGVQSLKQVILDTGRTWRKGGGVYCIRAAPGDRGFW